MPDSSYHDTARHFFVDDLPEASISGTRLQKVLESLNLGDPLTQLSLAFLEKQGLVALRLHACGESSFASFREAALEEQARRVKAADTEARAREVVTQERRDIAAAQAEAARLAMEGDPRHIARNKNRELLRQFDVDMYVEPECFRPLVQILKQLDAEQRLSEADFVWLSSAGDVYFTDAVRRAYHKLEAEFFAREHRKTHDPWAAVNASGHYRKCGHSEDAERLLAPIQVQPLASAKLKSALCTTHGGVMRDLGQTDAALALGQDAHTYMPGDFRPCTLLGAVHMELGNYSVGQEWYKKAVERGATEEFVDIELRNILIRADQTKRAEMCEFLLQQSPARYKWVRKLLS